MAYGWLALLISVLPTPVAAGCPRMVMDAVDPTHASKVISKGDLDVSVDVLISPEYAQLDSSVHSGPMVRVVAVSLDISDAPFSLSTQSLQRVVASSSSAPVILDVEAIDLGLADYIADSWKNEVASVEFAPRPGPGAFRVIIAPGASGDEGARLTWAEVTSEEQLLISLLGENNEPIDGVDSQSSTVFGDQVPVPKAFNLVVEDPAADLLHVSGVAMLSKPLHSVVDGDVMRLVTLDIGVYASGVRLGGAHGMYTVALDSIMPVEVVLEGASASLADPLVRRWLEERHGDAPEIAHEANATPGSFLVSVHPVAPLPWGKVSAIAEIEVAIY